MVDNKKRDEAVRKIVQNIADSVGAVNKTYEDRLVVENSFHYGSLMGFVTSLGALGFDVNVDSDIEGNFVTIKGVDIPGLEF